MASDAEHFSKCLWALCVSALEGSIQVLFTPVFTARLFTVAKIQKQPKCPSVDAWIKKVVVHLHNGIPGNIKKEGILTFCNSTIGTGEYYAK